jgi:transposase
MTPEVCLKTVGLRDLDFSDDRLSTLPDYPGRDEAARDSHASKQMVKLLRVHDLLAGRVRIDGTTKSHVAVTGGGLFPFGHIKEHRPVLPQLKINRIVIDPSVLPLRTTIVSTAYAAPAYREKYITEHGFKRLRGKLSGLTLLYLMSTNHIKGLIRLPDTGLRVPCLVEFTVPRALQEQSEKFDGIYAGKPKQATGRPTIEMMLRALDGISPVTVNFGQIDWHSLTRLNDVQSRMLALLGFLVAIILSSGAAIWGGGR